jgi:hypothetical protein
MSKGDSSARQHATTTCEHFEGQQSHVRFGKTRQPVVELGLRPRDRLSLSFARENTVSTEGAERPKRLDISSLENPACFQAKTSRSSAVSLLNTLASRHRFHFRRAGDYAICASAFST